MGRTNRVLTGAAATAAICTLLAGAAGAQTSREVLAAAVDSFFAGRVEASLEQFDRVIELEPPAMPYLWQRGIALYYGERWDDCRAQFEAHRTVNPNDVENAAWHFLCVARQESPERARAELLPVGPDSRRPMPRIYELYAGRATPEEVLEAAGEESSAVFYAHLYVGLYHEVLGEREAARRHLEIAAQDRFGSPRNYMHRVARTHVQLRSGG